MNPTIIGIAGGTASGKTTIAKRLYDEALKMALFPYLKLMIIIITKIRFLLAIMVNEIMIIQILMIHL